MSTSSEKFAEARAVIKAQMEARAAQMRADRKAAQESGDWSIYYKTAHYPIFDRPTDNHNLPFDRWPISEG